MKIRIKKIPLETELNARKWNHKHQTGGPTIDWMNYWYSNRPQQLVYNFDSYYTNNPLQLLARRFSNSYDKRVQDAYNAIESGIDYASNVPVNYGPLRYDISGYFQDDDSLNPYINLNIGATDDVLLHEQAHALNHKLGDSWKEGTTVFRTSPFISAIGNVTDEDLYYDGYWKYDPDEYLDNLDEIYSRLMLVRYLNKLDPKHKYTLYEIKKMRKENKLTLPNSDGLERYTDEFVKHLLNNVAYNDTKQLSNKAKNGGLISVVR